MKSFVGFAENIRFSLQEAFIALVPFVVLISAIRLIDFALLYSGVAVPFLANETLNDIGRLLDVAMPVMLAISVSYQLSILFRIDRVTGAALALAVFFFDTYGAMSIDDVEAISLASVNAVIAPLLALMILRACTRLPLPRLHHGALSYNLENALNMALPALLSFILTVAVLSVLHDAADAISMPPLPPPSWGSARTWRWHYIWPAPSSSGSSACTAPTLPISPCRPTSARSRSPAACRATCS